MSAEENEQVGLKNLACALLKSRPEPEHVMLLKIAVSYGIGIIALIQQWELTEKLHSAEIRKQ
jgi:hypothetical protein